MRGSERVHTVITSSPRRPRRTTCSQRLGNNCQFITRRWRLVLFSLPISALAIIIRLAVWSWSSGPHLQLDAGTTQVIVLAMILVTLLLLHESAGRFRTILFALRGVDAPRPSYVRLYECLDALASHLDDSGAYISTLETLGDAEADVFISPRTCRPSQRVVADVARAMRDIRAGLARIEAFTCTPFPLPSYTLLDCAAICVVTVLAITTTPSAEAGCIAIGIFAFFFSYLGLVVRSFERPFNYAPLFHVRCLEERGLPQLSSCEIAEEPSNIDFAMLFVDFACLLRAVISKLANPASPTRSPGGRGGGAPTATGSHSERGGGREAFAVSSVAARSPA